MFILILCILYLIYKKYYTYEKFVTDTWDKNTELILVSAHYNEDLEWLKKAPVPVVICGKEGEKDSVIKSNPKCKTINQGNEASSYIKFIIEYYDSLPQYVLFIHGHETAWHQKVDIFDEIKEHKWKNKDYCSVNKNGLEVGPHNKREMEQKFIPVWDTYFLPYLHRGPPTSIRTDCCAQFIISRNAILKHKKTTYEHWYKLLTVDYKNYPEIAPTSKEMAVIFEFLWHIIFGQPDEMTEL